MTAGDINVTAGDMFVISLICMFWGAFIFRWGFCANLKLTCTKCKLEDDKCKENSSVAPFSGELPEQGQGMDSENKNGYVDNKILKFHRLFSKEKDEDTQKKDETDEITENIFYK